MVDVTHDRDHRRSWQLLAFGRDMLLFKECVRIVKFGREGLVAHLLDQDHRRLLVELLVDRDHLAQLHQLLDHLGGLDRHLVCQVGHADGLGHMHFLDHLLGGGLEVALNTLIAIATASTARRTPTRTVGCAAIGAAFACQSALLGCIVSPARRQLFTLDRFLVAWFRGARACCGRTRHRLGFVNGAQDGFFGQDGLGQLLGLFSRHHLLGRAHHRPDRSSLVLGGLTTLGHRSHGQLFSSLSVSSFDDADAGLGCLDRRCHRDRRRHRRCKHGCNDRRRASRDSGFFDRSSSSSFSSSLGRRFSSFTLSPRLSRDLGLRGLRSGLGGLALGLLALGPCSRHLSHLVFLASQLLRLGVGLLFAAMQVSLGRGRLALVLDTRWRVIALDEHALLANLDLDRAGLARSVGLLDLAGALASQRDLLAISTDCAMRLAQEFEQAFPVGIGQRVVGRTLRDTSRLQLLEQRPGRTVELGCELGDGRHGHGWISLRNFNAMR